MTLYFSNVEYRDSDTQIEAKAFADGYEAGKINNFYRPDGYNGAAREAYVTGWKQAREIYGR